MIPLWRHLVCNCTLLQCLYAHQMMRFRLGGKGGFLYVWELVSAGDGESVRETSQQTWEFGTFERAWAITTYHNIAAEVPYHLVPSNCIVSITMKQLPCNVTVHIIIDKWGKMKKIFQCSASVWIRQSTQPFVGLEESQSFLRWLAMVNSGWRIVSLTA